MKPESKFFKQARLMLRVLPFTTREKCFALKGGTAINFFVRDMPRLSVDIDLTYLPVEPREESLTNISAALLRVDTAIRKAYRSLHVQQGKASGGKRVTKLFVSDDEVQIKIEPNEVLRGAVFGSEMRTVSAKVEVAFELSVTARVLSLADLYGGKLCAALDRQHPRDLFDVKLLLENEGITSDIRRAFVVYLAGHDRPINELIAPALKNVRSIYDKEFVGMTTEPVEYESLMQARDKLVSTLGAALTHEERAFLVSVKERSPRWDLLRIPGIEKLPSIRWKLANLAKVKPEKHAALVEKLKRVLAVS